ncbi:MAG: hypothetical protein ABSD57_14995 [Verrucomicrobiota bacterium]
MRHTYAAVPPAAAQNACTGPVLTRITNSSVKLEQIIGDYDWAALAHGTNGLIFSQTVCGVKPGELIHTFGDLLAASRGKRGRVSQRMLDGNWLAE